MKNLFIVIFSIALCFTLGLIASHFQVESLTSWYPTLQKSPLNPPNSIFPIMWSILYLCMGLSIGLILCSNLVKESLFIKLFGAQLLLNFLWSISFFYLRNPLLGLINIILLLILIIIYAVKTYPYLKISSILFIPYIIWVGFASYLNFYIWLYN